jgi:HD-GYP domain-containing protein (c-di-GMP phosphodiesterase class II)
MLYSLADWIYYHHERIDGTGYYGLKGDDIPLEARILSVADCYSALTTDRVYHKSKTKEVASQIMESVKDTQLDSEIVDIFLQIPEEELIQCIPSEMY